MDFRPDKGLLDNDIFVHTGEKLGIALKDFTFISRGEEYLKTIVSD